MVSASRQSVIRNLADNRLRGLRHALKRVICRIETRVAHLLYIVFQVGIARLLSAVFQPGRDDSGL